MLRYLSLRVLYTLPVVWLVVSLVFLLIHLVPGDPILQMLGEGAPVTDVQAARHAYGLDLPLGRQYLNYWEGVLRGDLGPSLRFNQSVTRLIAQRYPYTLQLTLAALVVAVLLSVPAGVRSAQRRNRWDDRLLSVVSLFGLSFPNFALGPILILFFAIKLGWLPVSGSGSWRTWCCPRSPWAARWPRSSPAWCAPPCWKSWARTTSAPPAPRDCPSAPWSMVTPCATP